MAKTEFVSRALSIQSAAVKKTTGNSNTPATRLRKYAGCKAYTGEIGALIKALRPAQPLYVLYPDIIKKTAQHFMSVFPGKALYAVKTNPDPVALQALTDAGMTTFDVASIKEIREVRAVQPHAELYFMHPVKAPEAIQEAYFTHGVRNFVLDCEEELYKIVRHTNLAQDLKLFVRISLPKNDTAQIDFSSKFGAAMADAVDLLQKCRPVTDTLGLSFHVGTQTASANKYAKAIEYAARIIQESGVKLDVLNVGGGFPVPYPGEEDVCTIEDCVGAIKFAMTEHGLDGMPLIAEPGRYLVAEGGKLVTRVELRKNDLLYLNDGVYGGLFDACSWLGLRYPVDAVSCDAHYTAENAAFRMAGPTCDSLDMMNGPFMLPNDIGMGDWVIVGNTGAYSKYMRSDFNGFGECHTVCLFER